MGNFQKPLDLIRHKTIDNMGIVFDFTCWRRYP